jgi:hypothetical protein
MPVETLGRAELSFLIDPAGQAKALAFTRVRDQLEETRAVLAHLLFDPVNVTDKVERAIAIARENGGSIHPEAASKRLEDMQREAAAVRCCLSIFDTLGSHWARPDLNLEVIEAVRNAVLSAPDEVAGLVSLGSLAEVETVAAEFLARQMNLNRKLQDLRASLPRIGSHPARIVLEAADLIEASGMFASLSSAYRRALAFYREELGGKSDTPKASMMRALRTYADLLQEKVSLDDPVLRARFGAGFVGYDTLPSFFEACVTHVRRVSSHLQRWPDLCNDVLGGGAARIAALDLSGLPNDMDRPAAVAVIGRLEGEISRITVALSLDI